MPTAYTADRAFAFATEDWCDVADLPLAGPASEPPDLNADPDAGVLIVMTRGVAGRPDLGYTYRRVLTGDQLADALEAAGLLPPRPENADVRS